MANSSLSNSTRTSAELDEEVVDHTITFAIGFGVLMLFLVMGVIASAFLCITVKKDPYLWPVETDKGDQEEQQCCASGKLKCEEAVVLECTQI